MLRFVLDKRVKGNPEFLQQRLNQLSDGKWQVTVKPYKSVRSNSQNSLYWAFLTEFGKHLGYSKDEMHDLCRFKYLSEKVEINGEIVTKLKSTPKTDTSEFSDYYEMCVMWAASLGFVGEK